MRPPAGVFSRMPPLSIPSPPTFPLLSSQLVRRQRRPPPPPVVPTDVAPETTSLPAAHPTSPVAAVPAGTLPATTHLPVLSFQLVLRHSCRRRKILAIAPPTSSPQTRINQAQERSYFYVGIGSMQALREADFRSIKAPKISGISVDNIVFYPPFCPAICTCTVRRTVPTKTAWRIRQASIVDPCHRGRA